MIYVTGSAKISHVRTKTEIILLHKIIASYIREISIHSVSTAQCDQVCFSGDFADPVMSHARLREWHLAIEGTNWVAMSLLARRLLALWCGIAPFWLLLVAFPTLNS